MFADVTFEKYAMKMIDQIVFQKYEHIKLQRKTYKYMFCLT